MSVGVVHVGVIWVAAVDASLVKGLGAGEEGLQRDTMDWKGAVTTVEVAAIVGVPLHIEEVREYVDVGPLVVTEGCPFVKVLGQAAEEKGPVDGAGAAHHSAPVHELVPALVPVNSHQEVTFVARFKVGVGAKLAPFYVLRRLFHGWVVGTFFQEED